MIKKIICFVIMLCILLIPAYVYSQQSLILGGGSLSPNSDKNDENLDDGWMLLAAVDHRFYENNNFNFLGGLMYIYANYDDSENLNEDSNLFFLYAKPSLKISSFMPYVIVGAGTDSEYYDGLTGLVGAGIDYNFYERWSVGVSYLHAENNERSYDMGVASIKYDF